MTLGRFKIIGCLGIMSIGLFGCPDPPTYPITPEIEFKDFYTDVTDANIGYLSINFTDGDGDIGLNEGQTSAPFDTSSYYYYNMYAQYFEFNGVTGEWEPTIINGDTLTFTFRVPDITPDGENKALKGSIQVELNPFYRDPASSNDSIKYRIKLIDRALHESEWIETPVIYKGIPL